ncbi:hypothetical protein D3C72_2094290 [compost metagenome]
MDTQRKVVVAWAVAVARVVHVLRHRSGREAACSGGAAGNVAAISDGVGVNGDLLGNNLRVQRTAVDQREGRHGGGHALQNRATGERTKNIHADSS